MKNSFRWLNLIGLAAVLVINGLAQWLPINGKITGELSAKYPVLITPAPYAFSIWSVIYLLLIGYVAYQMRPLAASSKIGHSIGPWFLISCLLNIAWILVWHYEKLGISVFIMLALLLSLIVIYKAVRKDNQSQAPGERYLVRLPFSIYLGWISTATIVNITVAISATDWNGFGLSDVIWTVTLLVGATLLALAIGFEYRDPAFILVFIWSFIAVAVKEGQHTDVSVAAFILAALLAASAVYVFIITSKRKAVSY
ncbi:TspO/MBR family protein [Paenibacillus sp. LHD-38]|uniref:TspO/MBR family protein n=1 Tax=Paenibacillus sp. LHD-38 TaxID=3072143 RepID=UPI00280D2A9C|nr:TspO/MBR family protein [Paenibacillus sp. LHD-38]MDQ8739182.1 TspO/MBR family protein [Paenibacillus sp. LHD-38]